eukprot:scaffold92455_cov61-Phaeocystis_antarctica.AAC.2
MLRTPSPSKRPSTTQHILAISIAALGDGTSGPEARAIPTPAPSVCTPPPLRLRCHLLPR